MQAGASLRVNQLAIPADLEHATARAYQLDLGAGEFLLDARLQLESPGAVASGITVFDANVHVPVLLGMCRAYPCTRRDARTATKKPRELREAFCVSGLAGCFLRWREVHVRDAAFFVDARTCVPAIFLVQRALDERSRPEAE